MYFFWLLIYVSGQIDRETESLSGQVAILAGHFLLTGSYFEPWWYIQTYL